MSAIISQSAPADPQPGDLVRAVLCDLCWSPPGRACTVTGPPGDHLARYVAAVRQGLLSREELAAVVGGLTVIADHVTITERQEVCWYCDRAGLPLEQCGEHHPGDLMCADRADCRDFMLAQLAETRQA